MELNWSELLSKESDSLFLVNSRSRDIDIFIRKTPPNRNSIIRKIQGKNCNTAKELFKEFSSAFQFPYYFGSNWNAFDECISDLSWLGNNKGYIIFITNAESLLTKDLEIFIDVISTVMNYWKDKDKFFKVIFQTEKEINPKIKSISALRELKPFDDVM